MFGVKLTKSIQDFISPDILKNFKTRTDLNMLQCHTWQTKLMIDENIGAERYLMEQEDINHPETSVKMELLKNEMRDVYCLMA